MPIHKIIPIKMKKDDMNLDDVQAFRCGSKPHETPLADWIKKHSADQIRGGTKVWLYRLENKDGPLVGYGSISTGKFKTTEPDDTEREVKMYEIPMLALHEDYWGMPPDIMNKEEKYSRQLVRDLQEKAREYQKLGQREPLLTLYVHPHAIAAQNLYLACGFSFADRFLSVPEVPPEIGPGLLGMEYEWC